MTRLRKAQVEALLRDYDADPVGALTVALRVVLGRPAADWVELIAVAPMSPARRAQLCDRDPRTLDELAAELNERRDLVG